MRKKITIGLVCIAGVGLAGCESNGFTSSTISKDILHKVNSICGPARDSQPRGGVVNIMLMEGREDDGIVTCHDGTNHYFDG